MLDAVLCYYECKKRVPECSSHKELGYTSLVLPISLRELNIQGTKANEKYQEQNYGGYIVIPRSVELKETST